MGFFDRFRSRAALRDPDWRVRQAAVEKIGDQQLLMTIAETDADVPVRLAAVDQLTDPILLTALAKGADEHLWFAAGTRLVERTADQAKLADLTKSSRQDTVRTQAVRKLRDQRLLADIATTHPEPLVRRFAVEQLVDPDLLATIARSDGDEWVRHDSVKMLTDQAVLAEIARTDDSRIVQEAAVASLADEGLLSALARDANRPEVREAAAERLTDRKLRVGMTRTGARSEAAWVDQLGDSAGLVDIAKHASSQEASLVAVSKITDQVALAEIAISGRHLDTQRAAIRQLTDQPALFAVVKSGRIGSDAALKKITDQKILAEIATSDLSSWERRLAVERLDDPDLVSRFATVDDANIREAALRRLAQLRPTAAVVEEEKRRQISALRDVKSRKAAAEALVSLNLAPETLGQEDRARFHVGLREWNDAGRIGSAAFEPLLEELEGEDLNYEQAAEAFGALLQIRRDHHLPADADEKLMAALESWTVGLRKRQERSPLPAFLDAFRKCQYAYLEALAEISGVRELSGAVQRARAAYDLVPWPEVSVLIAKAREAAFAKA